MPAEELVRFAERDEFNEGRIVAYLTDILAPLDLASYGAVVLGCTHFNYFLPELKKVFPEGTHFIDGVGGTIRRTADLLNLRLREQIGTGLEGGIQADRGDVGSQIDLSTEPDGVASYKVTYFFSGRELTSYGELQRMERLHDRLEACHTG